MRLETYKPKSLTYTSKCCFQQIDRTDGTYHAGNGRPQEKPYLLELLLQLQPVRSDPPLLVARHDPHHEPRLPPELHQLIHAAVDQQLAPRLRPT
jgi:hypothetical protein